VLDLPLGVYDTFRNALAVEVRKKIHEVEVLEQKRSVLANPLCLVRVGVWHSIRSCVDHLLIRSMACVTVGVKGLGVSVTVGIVCVGCHFAMSKVCLECGVLRR
jgi:hypothetical protein